MDSATALLEREGLAALSLRAVARAVGVSHAAPAHHFADKTALLAAVAARGFAELADALEAGEAAARDEGAAGALREAGRGYVRFALGRPRLYDVMFDPQHSIHAAGDAELARESTRALTALRRVAERAAPGAPEGYAALTAWSSVHGAVLLHHDGLADLVLGLPPTATTTVTDAVRRAAFDRFADALTAHTSSSLARLARAPR